MSVAIVPIALAVSLAAWTAAITAEEGGATLLAVVVSVLMIVVVLGTSFFGMLGKVEIILIFLFLNCCCCSFSSFVDMRFLLSSPQATVPCEYDGSGVAAGLYTIVHAFNVKGISFLLEE